MNKHEKNKLLIKKIRYSILVLLFITCIPAGLLFYGYLNENNLLLFIGLGLTIFFLLLSVIITFLVNYYDNKLDENQLINNKNIYTKFFFNLEEGVNFKNFSLTKTIYFLKIDDKHFYLKNKIEEEYKIFLKDISSTKLIEKDNYSILNINLKDNNKLNLKINNTLENILKNEIFNNIIYVFETKNLLEKE